MFIIEQNPHTISILAVLFEINQTIPIIKGQLLFQINSQRISKVCICRLDISKVYVIKAFKY